MERIINGEIMEKNIEFKYPIIKVKKNNFLILAYGKDEFLKARKSIGICNLSFLDKILVSGENALELLNYYSGINLFTLKENTTMSVFFKNKKFLGEGQILKISEHRFLIMMKNAKPLYKALKKIRRNFSYTVINKVTTEYSFFSFHGEKANEFFEKIVDQHLYKVNNQGYTYYTMLGQARDEKNIISHFSNQNFVMIGLCAFKTFLNSNNVVDDLSKVKKNILKCLLPSIYKIDNLKIKRGRNNYRLVQYEIQGKYRLDKTNKIYDNKRKKIGYIYSSFYLPYKSNPFALSIANDNKACKIALLKAKKKEILMKKVFL